ncbi:Nudix-related transcriptional regulator NrtR [hydrothermal vent metagenome]|uniref:Nudix-related transcriptional regulator NrtR n=1 Tax=hydrothermal vent metagenome TaxID=652676 RepID=A0A3B0Z9C7_9ZZZZ
MHCYSYPHPAVTTDIAVFSIFEDQLNILLIQRANEPFKGHWALPGGFVEIDEDLNEGAARELYEETNLSHIYLEQLYTFGAPQRDPRERVITVAYYALVASSEVRHAAAGSDAVTTKWFPILNLPILAFDHKNIIDTALERLIAKVRYSTIALQLLPQQFTLHELQQIYEIILNENLDKRNFRKKILALDCVVESGQQRRDGQHRPAKLYVAKNKQVDFTL